MMVKEIQIQKKKIPSSLQQEVVHLVWKLLGLLVAILVSFSFQPAKGKRTFFKAKLLVFPTSIRNLNDKVRKILKDKVEKLETLSSSSFWRIFSLALFSSSFSSLRNSIMLPMEGKKLVRSEYNKIKQKLVQAQIQRRKETNRFLSFCSSILLASRSSLPIRILS